MIKSETSTLFLITAYNSKIKKEYIIFANFKEELLGEENNDIKLLKKIELYKTNEITYNQRFYMGKKSKLEEKYIKLIESKIMKIEKEEFYLNCDIKKKHNVSLINNIEIKEKYKKTEFLYNNYEVLEETDFLHIFDNFSKILGEEIDMEYTTRLFPYKYIKLNRLDSFVRNKICLRYEKLFFISNFQAVRSNSELDPLNYIGQINYSPILLKNLGIAMVDDEKRIMDIDTSEWNYINIDNGTWNIKLTKRMSKGVIVYKNLKTKEIIAVNKFTLMQKLNLNVSLIDSELKDIYQNKINFSKNNLKDAKGTKNIEKKLFLKESYPKYKELAYSKEISKYLEDIFTNLGSEIVIVDPYLLGQLENITNSQKAVISAIERALTRVKIKKLTFICLKKNVEKNVKKNNQPIYQEGKYDRLIKHLKEIQSELEIKIIFVQKEKLHDRYIIGLDRKKVISVSKSINGLCSGEVTYNTLDEISSKRLIRKYINLIQKGD